MGLLIIPIDELIFFRGVAQPPTSNKSWILLQIAMVMSEAQEGFFHHKVGISTRTQLKSGVAAGKKQVLKMGQLLILLIVHSIQLA